MFDTLQAEMGASFEVGGDQTWVDVIKRFGAGVGPAIDQATAAMPAFDAEMEALGFEGFKQDGGEDRNSLSGAIASITEDTAQILAGILNAIRIDVRQSVENADEMLGQLQRIGDNTEYNVLLEDIDDKLGDIKTSLA